MSSEKARWVTRVAGAMLLLGGLATVAYSARVATAQAAYFRLKFGSDAVLPPEDKTPLAEQAYALYPQNYYLSMLLSAEAWEHRHDADDQLVPDRISSATRWCERGLRQNPYRRELRWMEAQLAGLQSPGNAAAIWARYVDLAFWDAWNLASLAILLADAGRIEEALELLPLLNGKPDYKAAAAAVERAWAREYRRPQ